MRKYPERFTGQNLCALPTELDRSGEATRRIGIYPKPVGLRIIAVAAHNVGICSKIVYENSYQC